MTTLRELARRVKSYKGLTRKACVGELARIFDVECKFEDAGWFEVDSRRVVATADGIIDEFVKEDPWLAGFYSVLVNVNDIIAKGASPVGYMAVIASGSAEARRKIVEGIKFGLEKYRLKILKLHTHPDTSYNFIGASIVGIANQVIPSSTAIPGDRLVLGIDLRGKFGKRGWINFFDSTREKTYDEVARLMEAMIKLSELKLAHASRDVSAPGFIGSAAMLCESSGVGAKIAIDRIPKPVEADLSLWLTTYPSTGFLVATSRLAECIALFKQHGYESVEIGKITRDRKLILTCGKESEVFMDFKRESVFGVLGS